jgi:cytochrome P450/ferredoxin-NADP reductase
MSIADPFRTAPSSSSRAAATGVYFDPLSYAAYDHPYEIYRELRDQAPIYYNELRDLYVVSRYAEVQAVLRDHVRLVNALGNDIDGTHASYGKGNLVAQDLPRHAVLRAAVRPSFSAREILALEDHVRALARQQLARLRAAGSGDFAMDVALPLVFGVALKFVGVPSGDVSFWVEHLLRSMVRTVGHLGVPDDAVASNGEAEHYIGEVVARRRAEIAAGADAEAPDVISQILLAASRGDVEEDEVVGLAHLVLSAATDAPAALLTNCVAVLDKYPALQVLLHGQPGLIPAFVEETLRYDGPAKNLSRQTVADVTLAGVTIPADSRVMILMASANRDERVFENPDRFDLGRVFGPENKILSFGEGIHSCMGAPLARLTARVVLEELLDGSELHVVGTPERWVKQMVRGFSRLPVRLEPAPAGGAGGIAAQRTRPRVDLVQNHSTRLTLATREFEAEVTVESKTVVSDGVVALGLRELEGQPLPGWQPGAHVDLVIAGAPTKQYSLCGDPAERGRWRLGILRDEAGSGASRYVHDSLQAGDVVRVRGPRNNFPLVESPAYLFVAGGIGITPVLPMIRAAEAAGAHWRLVYGGRTRASMAFLDELAGYGDRVLVQPQDEVGLLDLDALLGEPSPDTQVYCCGPEPLLAAVESRVTASWPHGSLHVERFAPRPLTEPVLSEAFEVHLARHGGTVTVPPELSVLAALETAGVPVLSSCAEGTCGTCETTVLEGVPDHRDSVLTDDERAAGDCMMICVSRSCTTRLVLDL